VVASGRGDLATPEQGSAERKIEPEIAALVNLGRRAQKIWAARGPDFLALRPSCWVGRKLFRRFTPPLTSLAAGLGWGRQGSRRFTPPHHFVRGGRVPWSQTPFEICK
jgi:hypothetical protein